MSKNKSLPHSGHDLMGMAMLEFIKGESPENVGTWTSVAGDDELPLTYLFRSFDEMPRMEQTALENASGSVLDIGCGSGSHALWLEEKGHEVKAIDISSGAIETCRLRGVRNAHVQDIWELEGEAFDTLLILMNGMGICGTLDKLPALLEKLKSLLRPGGQILADSSDLIYMFDNENDPPLPQDHYYGEVQFQTRYKGQTSEVFPWLYVDFNNLKHQATQVGLNCELICPGDHYDYLARLTLA